MTTQSNTQDEPDWLVDHSIDVRYEPNLIKAFNKFIKKWCPDYAHLLDSDDNDGEFIRARLKRVELEGRQKQAQIYLDRINNYESDPAAPSFGSASGGIETAGWKQAFESDVEELESQVGRK